ncbi:hypothetical protein COT86_03670 [Candidatus Collierbacteria bacterium CG10_big_fil_rev_8_21_14_0_10_43_36]|uniref:Uncharacterized protein n=3 Tax=Candidatus Collieribacteriota TaxID=1752725 RepID=A0A2H0DTE2_9BACT|nr:MAG: hypothetical protein COW83_04205 [Candidatus Collierbacteria bacterium CG22_combo_CG10-13_8_21_14_all_43_12]PIR99489.1 MAG: hypothetical protein COT86_03670 [Candidatus Collierbacteria bacterium CG10_big_fil_rev_8_21_14_0_10_43_36]PIZ24358.1 MAG: hypothetical protein COY48_03440 [Candidatus Collierbacteria bacterium CG_4_10_14_0_8_um_filter_43_86]PJB48808.1 MAG: hypothetical protein CO104_00455 [Candidatus Collierbacteria bacterium CG_4_9_14_3_um_filter_43_16]
MIPVIICGGVGTKMWPLSTPALPKQFLPLIADRSLFELNWEMLRNRYQPEEIFIQTNQEQAKIIKRLVPEVVEINIFIEPESRNQGPATGLAAALLKKLGRGDEPFFLIQVDVLRNPAEKFFLSMDLAEKLATSSDQYISGGFVPTRMLKGVDFLLKGKQVGELGEAKIFEVDEFVYRNDVEKIRNNFKTGRLLVHTNHTSMTPNNLLKMFHKYRPDWYNPLTKIASGSDIRTEFQKMPKGALEEVTKKAIADRKFLVIEHPFEWTDFGTWESLDKYYTDNDMSPRNGGIVEIESTNSFCYSENKMKIAIVGLNDIVVVEGNGGILVCKKDKCGHVAQIV